MDDACIADSAVEDGGAGGALGCWAGFICWFSLGAAAASPRATRIALKKSGASSSVGGGGVGCCGVKIASSCSLMPGI